MKILGVKVHNFRFKGALRRACDFLQDGKQHYIVTPNPEIVLHARRSREYRAILNKAHLSIPDGTGVVWASRYLFGRKHCLKERICGVDFMEEFLRRMAFEAYGRMTPRRVLLLGGRRDAAKIAADNLKKKFPALRFFGIEPINSPHLSFVVNEIIQPECLFVGLGAPKQEEWIAHNLLKFPTVKVAMGVGGSFDFIAGRVPRAPKVLQEMGLEWLWRFAHDPRRARRMFNAVVVFPLLVLIHSLHFNGSAIMKIVSKGHH
jgi:N-acetylglucosaminyldiphosphoundecaprenol N-acetyl-beta-D-mannosaminyltransferase